MQAEHMEFHAFQNIIPFNTVNKNTKHNDEFRCFYEYYSVKHFNILKNKMKVISQKAKEILLIALFILVME